MYSLIVVPMIILVAVGASPADVRAQGSSGPLVTFVAAAESLATSLHLPGLSVAVVQEQEMAWSGGFGFADLEQRVPAAGDTPYRLASLSKPLASLLLMMLVEEGTLDLDARMADFVIHPWFEPGGGSWAHYPSRYVEGPITVRHVLTHTSQASPPGDAYAYSGNIFADLTWVVEDVARKSYPVVLRERILQPLGMNRSSPGQLAPWIQDVVAEIATPYRIKNGEAVPGNYPGFGLDPETDVTPWNLDPAYRAPSLTTKARRDLLGSEYRPLYSLQTAAGVVSTVEDLARFDIALDNNVLVSEEGKQAMWTAARTSEGEALPYGLGWFVEEVRGFTVVWHFGWFPPTVSALYVKIPERGVSTILLSNCDGLSAGVAWTELGVQASPFARAFLEVFVPGP